LLTHESQEVVRLKTYCNKELDNIVNIYNGHLQGVLFSEVHCNLEGGGASMARPLLEKAEKALGEEGLKKLDCNWRGCIHCTPPFRPTGE